MADPYYREFGNRVRDARGHRWTQQQIAARVGLSRAAVANIERGRQRVPLHMIAKFAQALGVDQETLLPSATLATSQPDAELRRLSAPDRASIEAVMNSLAPEDVDAED